MMMRLLFRNVIPYQLLGLPSSLSYPRSVNALTIRCSFPQTTNARDCVRAYVCCLQHLSVGKPYGHLWNCFLSVSFESAPGWGKANSLVNKKKGSTLRMTWAWQTVFTKWASVHTNLSQCTLLMSNNPGMPTLLETLLPASSWEAWLFWHMGRQGKSIDE